MSAFGSSFATRRGCLLKVASVRPPALILQQPRFAVVAGTRRACRLTARGVSRLFTSSADHKVTSETVCTHLHKPVKAFGNVFVAPTAVVLGDVTLKSYSSVWYGAVIRADLNSVIIGEESNVQDGACIHLSSTQGVVIGNGVTIGHKAIIHGCSVQDNCLIGMGAILMDGCLIGENSIVGAGSLVSPGKVFPPNSLIVGSPAKRVRDVTEVEIKMLRAQAAKYVKVQTEFRDL